MFKLISKLTEHSGRNGYDVQHLTASYNARRRFTHCYSWAIPTPEAIRLIASYSPIVEVGAGMGLWSYLLSKAGADVVAYDATPCSKRNQLLYRNCRRQFFPVRQGGPRKALKHSNRTLFLCWPPYDDPMALQCLQNYRGSTVIYIGEGWGGCTGCDEFHNILENDFVIKDEADIPQWDGLHDMITVWVRRDYHGRTAH